MSDEQLAACAVPRTFGQTLLFEGAIIYLKS